MRRLDGILTIEQSQAGFAVFEEKGLLYITRFNRVCFITGPSMETVKSIRKTVESIQKWQQSDTK